MGALRTGVASQIVNINRNSLSAKFTYPFVFLVLQFNLLGTG